MKLLSQLSLKKYEIVMKIAGEFFQQKRIARQQLIMNDAEERLVSMLDAKQLEAYKHLRNLKDIEAVGQTAQVVSFVLEKHSHAFDEI